MNSAGARILGTGMAVPERVMTNADIEKVVATTDEWIVERSGIRQRHIAEPGMPLSTLAADAGRMAIEEAGITAAEVDLIIVATVTGDMKFPSAACFVQEKLGAINAAAFDIAAACSGFLYGLSMADALIRLGSHRHILVIGGEILSSMVDWSDRETCVLFGDGAGAALLGPANGSDGILSSVMKSDGRHTALLQSPGCGSLHPPTVENLNDKLQYIKMQGREVFRQAIPSMSHALHEALDRAGLAAEALDLVIPHQANIRIIQGVAKNFGLPVDKVFVNIERYGNTSAASIGIALHEARRSARIKPGQLVGLVAFGAGFTSAAVVVRF